MMDLREKKSGLDSRDVEKKSCSDCRTTKTPLWRLGPAGPKTLCNACGIKYTKKRRQLLGLDRVRNQSGKKKMKNQKRSNGVGRSVKMMRLMALGREMGLNLSSANFGEEDAAAILLLALSYAR